MCPHWQSYVEGEDRLDDACQMLGSDARFVVLLIVNALPCQVVSSLKQMSFLLGTNENKICFNSTSVRIRKRNE